MEKRKIQTTKSGSYFITLPKVWIKKKGLMLVEDKQKSKELILTENEEGNLIISSGDPQKISYSEFIIPIEEYEEKNSLERCINSSYIQGSDIITIISKKTIALDKKRLVKDMVLGLIGSEISEEFSNRIIIRILVDPVRFPLSNLIERIYLLVSSMHVDAMRAFIEADKLLAEDVINRGKEVDKLFFLMLRQLNLSLTNRLNFADICASNMKIDCVLGIVLARDLSKMAHYATEIASEVIKLINKEVSQKLKDHLIKMSRFTIKMQQNAILAFFKNDFMRANKIINDIQEVVDFDLETEATVLKNIEDPSVIVSLISISRNLRNIANSAVAVSQDLQAKYRPKETQKKEALPQKLPEAEDLIISPDYGNETE
jgi:phosphate uptake regulator